jgi:hypothetical protein
MTTEAVKEARTYLRNAVASQRRAGSRGRVPEDVFDSAVAEAARAVEKLLRAQQRRAA